MVPDHCNKVRIVIKQVNLFVGGESCFQFVKNTIPVKCNKTKYASNQDNMR